VTITLRMVMVLLWYIGCDYYAEYGDCCGMLVVTFMLRMAIVLLWYVGCVYHAENGDRLIVLLWYVHQSINVYFNNLAVMAYIVLICR